MDMRTKRFALAGLVVTLVVAGLLSFYASSSPDGLEKVASDIGISAQESDHPLEGSPLRDYAVRGIANDRVSVGVAGVVGVVVTLLVCEGVLRIARRRRGTGTGTREPR